MRNPLRLALLPALFAVSLALGGCSCSDSDNPMSHFEGLVGHWTGTQRMVGDDTEYQASYSISLDENVLVHNFTSDYAGGFSGHEDLYFDTEANHLIAKWTDSMQPEPSQTTGHFDDLRKELTMTGEGPDFNDPNKTVTYRHFTHYNGNKMNYTMSIIDEAGVATDVMEIKMTKDSD